MCQLPKSHTDTRCRWELPADETRDLLLHGRAACLYVTTNGRTWCPYLVCPQTGSLGLTGWTLLKMDGPGEPTAAYNLPADLSSCECPDFQKNGSRRSCKHQRAALAALRRVYLDPTT